MQRRIVNFHQDEFEDWVAKLECGHAQHVRHNPPWVNRPWVVTHEGRDSMIGVAGLSHLGINTAAAFAAHGFDVVAYDDRAAIVTPLQRVRMDGAGTISRDKTAIAWVVSSVAAMQSS